MKKLPTYSKTFFLIAIAMGATLFGATIFEGCSDLFLFIPGTKYEPLGFWAAVLFCSSILAGVAFLLIKNTKAALAATLALLLLLSPIAVFFRTLSYSGTFHTFTSENNTVVIEERGALLSGGFYVYQKVSPCTLKLLGKCATDDAYFPFSDNSARVEFGETEFSVHYVFDPMTGVYKNETFKYLK